MNLWKEHIYFWELCVKQTSDEWFQVKQDSLLLTCSNFGSAIGHNEYTTPDELVYNIKNNIKKEQNEAMLFGIETEPEARKWYEQRFQCKIKETGMYIPKWDLRIGASLDGEIEGTNGMIEIKCPKKMYYEISDDFYHSCDSTKRINYNIGDGRIKTYYYDQIQGCMAIAKKDWCDFIVYCKPENRVFVKRVEFNKSYWENILYPKVKWFLDNKLYI